MKKFIKKSLIFILAVNVTSFLLQQMVFSLIKSIDVGDFGVMNKIVEGKINAEILICGSSRSYVGIDPITMSKATGLKVFNISLNGSRLGVQLPVLKTYLKYNKKPKILIQELGFESLTLDNKIYAPYKYLPYLSKQELYKGLKKIDPELWYQKYSPTADFIYLNTDFQKMFLRDLYFTLIKKNDYLHNGYNPNSNTWTINEQEFINHPRNIYFKSTKEAEKYLIEIIEICKKLDINLMFVTTPAYYKIQQLEFNQKNMIETYTKISQKYKILYINYLHTSISEQKDYFYNFTHLAENGAKKFSSIISEDIIKNYRL